MGTARVAFSKTPFLSVVVPAFDEESRLPPTIAGIQQYFAQSQLDYELILVDDGSRDGTPEIIKRAAEADHRVRPVLLPANKGKGRALAAGVQASHGSLILTTDADLSTPIEEFTALHHAIDTGADVAIASRAKRGARILSPQPPHRVLMGRAFNLFIQLLLVPGLHDTQCGFKLFRGDVGRALFGDLRTDGFAYDVEVLARARRTGCRVSEVPVCWVHSAPTKVSPVRHSAQMLRDVVALRWHLRPRRPRPAPTESRAAPAPSTAQSSDELR